MNFLLLSLGKQGREAGTFGGRGKVTTVKRTRYVLKSYVKSFPNNSLKAHL